MAQQPIALLPLYLRLCHRVGPRSLDETGAGSCRAVTDDDTNAYSHRIIIDSTRETSNHLS